MTLFFLIIIFSFFFLLLFIFVSWIIFANYKNKQNSTYYAIPITYDKTKKRLRISNIASSKFVSRIFTNKHFLECMWVSEEDFLAMLKKSSSLKLSILLQNWNKSKTSVYLKTKLFSKKEFEVLFSSEPYKSFVLIPIQKKYKITNFLAKKSDFQIENKIEILNTKFEFLFLFYLNSSLSNFQIQEFFLSFNSLFFNQIKGIKFKISHINQIVIINYSFKTSLDSKIKIDQTIKFFKTSSKIFRHWAIVDISNYKENIANIVPICLEKASTNNGFYLFKNSDLQQLDINIEKKINFEGVFKQIHKSNSNINLKLINLNIFNNEKIEQIINFFKTSHRLNHQGKIYYINKIILKEILKQDLDVNDIEFFLDDLTDDELVYFSEKVKFSYSTSLNDRLFFVLNLYKPKYLFINPSIESKDESSDRIIFNFLVDYLSKEKINLILPSTSKINIDHFDESVGIYVWDN